MPPMYEVTGYDRKTGRLSWRYDVAARRLASVKNAAGVPSSDDGLGAYPLNRDQVPANFQIAGNLVDSFQTRFSC